MKVKDISRGDIVINLTRDDATTDVTVIIEHNDMIMKASMRCQRTVENEAETSDKILKFLGFSDKFIRGMKND